MSSTEDSERWSRYYQAVQGRSPRPLFVAALAAFEHAGFDTAGAQAIDLGCGDGIETLALLAQGWQVEAIDQQPEASERILAAVPVTDRPRLHTQSCPFQDALLPSADFIYAGLSLPFCRPLHFPGIWQHVVQALRPGGRFAGHFFGMRDGWRDDPHMIFHTADDLAECFCAFEIETISEITENRPTALGEPKHWHIFEVIARRTS